MTGAVPEPITALLGADARSAQPIAGGSICRAFRVDTDHGSRFAKTHPEAPPGLFPIEAEGLAWLAEAGAVRVPEVVAVSERALVLDWIPPGTRSPGGEERLGRDLARLHLAGAPGFGWHRDGYIGDLPQRNDLSPTWPDLMAEGRILPLVRRALTLRRIAPEAGRLAERLCAHLPELAGPPEPPARLHGDLWWGNVVWDAAGEAWLVDPACHGGHRESDLAMLALFGTVPARLLAAYQEVHPLAPGWRGRVSLHQLQPLLVHAVLFGGGYGRSALEIMRAHAGPPSRGRPRP